MRKFRRPEKEIADVKPPEKKPSWLERIRERKRQRYVNTQLGGINMPKYQPCPLCGRGSKRREKTLGGANYHCPSHGIFFVRA